MTFDTSIYIAFHIQSLKGALKAMNLSPLATSNWKGLLFPIRPMPISYMTCLLGWHKTLGYQYTNNKTSSRARRTFSLSDFTLAIRGIRLGMNLRPQALENKDKVIVGLNVGSITNEKINVAVTSFLTEKEHFDAAASGKPSLTRQRFVNLTEFINDVISHRPPPDILVLPELSLPRSLVDFFVHRLGRSKVSLISGLEYGYLDSDKKVLLNQALITINLPTGYGQYQFLQEKTAPAWSEPDELDPDLDASIHICEKPLRNLPVYCSNGFYFGVLICSDLTNPRFRSRFQGRIDCLFALEWNKDVSTFESLVESSALDIHAYIVQANNRQFGDSRIRGPMKERFERDIVRLKGGVHDYFVIGEIDFLALREFQSTDSPDLTRVAKYKPFPIGFRLESWRDLRNRK